MGKGIISLGEALIDFIPLDENIDAFLKCPGGGPANVSVGCAKLGARSSFIGKVGKDLLGEFLINTLNNYHVDTKHVTTTDKARTGLTFVTLGNNGERSFNFYINPSADQYLEEGEVDKFPFVDFRLLHISSISLINEISRAATIKAVQHARRNKLLISYDPNLRMELWENEKVAHSTITSMLSMTDLLKISNEELEFLTGEHDIHLGVKKLEQYNIGLIFVTMGSDGSVVFTPNEGEIRIPALDIHAVDTTGAGDAYVSGMLFQLNELGKPIIELNKDEIRLIGGFASVCGGLTTCQKGAMTAFPTLEETERHLSRIFAE